MNSDADAALALALQLEEEEAARQEQQQHHVDEVARNLNYGLSLAAKHLSPASLAAARAVTPIDRLRREAKQAVLAEREGKKDEDDEDSKKKKKKALTETRALLDALLSWFKRDFFEWVDSPKCEACDVILHDSAAPEQPPPQRRSYKEKKDRSEKRCVGAAEPTAAERALGCGRVELWTCSRCGNDSLRFPRHNDVPTLLLETRGGRCGEFANAFTAVCNGAGLEARLVLDFSDHVWTEVFDAEERRWLHADSCEAVADEPLLYEAGWGKAPARAVVAFSAHAGDARARDVTRRYTRSCGPEDLEERRRKGADNGGGFTGEALRAAVARAGVVPLGANGASAAAAAERRRAADEELSGGTKATADEEEAGEENAAAPSLPARTAGDAEWIRSRGEDGKNKKKEEQPLPLPCSDSAAAASDAAAAAAAGEDDFASEIRRPLPLPCSDSAAAASDAAAAAAAGEDDFASEIRREFERLRMEDPELAPNEAAVRALQRVTERAK